MNTIYKGVDGDLNKAANWTGGEIPGSVQEDVVYFISGSNVINTNLGTLTGSAEGLTSVNIDQSYTGTFGTDALNVQVYMETDAPIINIGNHEGPGSPPGSAMILLDANKAGVQTINVENTGRSSDSAKPALRIKTSVQDHILRIRSGSVGTAIEPGEAAKFASIDIGYEDVRASDADVLIGPGTTVAAIDKTGGVCEIVAAAAIPNIINTAGTMIINSDQAVTTDLKVRGGNVIIKKSGTITLLTITGGYCDMTKVLIPITVTDCSVNGGGRLAYDDTKVTFTNPITSNNLLEVKGS